MIIYKLTKTEIEKVDNTGAIILYRALASMSMIY